MKRRRIHGGTGIATLLIAAGLLVPAGATAAPARPDVTTGPAANVAQSTATLTGSVNPNEAETTYFFEYGTTRTYGARVPDPAASVGKGNRRVAVTADISGLAPATTYHYRLVARNAKGVRRGADRTFRTQRQPLGLSLGATPNPVRPGGRTLIAGTLSGTGNAERQIVLQSNPFPYTQGFVGAANPQVTGTDGTFSFPVLSVPVTTQFRVVLAQRAEVTSPIVVVGAALQVRTDTEKVARHRHSVSVRFRGSVSPQNDGGRVGIQKFRNGVWTEIAHTRAKDAGSSKSVYNTRVRIYRSGLFRTVAEAEGQYVSGAGRAIRIKVRR
jgi:hypothetical protein